MEPPFRSNAHHEARIQYNGSGHSERMAPSNLGMNASPRMPIGHDSMNFSAYGQTQSSSLFNPDQLTSPQGWQPRVDRLAPTWMGSADARPLGSQKPNPYPPTSSTHSWSNASDQHSPPNSAHTSSQNYFPTLNTPFYPSQSHASAFQTNIPPSPSIPPHASNYDQLNHMQHPSNMPREFTPRGYGSGQTLASYPASGRDPLLYGQRNLPPVQTMTGYSQSQSPASSSAGSGTAPPAFWTRE